MALVARTRKGLSRSGTSLRGIEPTLHRQALGAGVGGAKFLALDLLG